jgi:hypothetical protein
MAAIGVTLGGGYAIKDCRPAERPITRPAGRQSFPTRRRRARRTYVTPWRGRRSYSVVVAFWKRPACDFSALARVSNQSAISGKPSSRAAFAIPGYMLVYS